MYVQLKQRDMRRPPVNVSTLARMKKEGEPIACLTAYDASFALLVDQSGADLVLVGDSLGMVIQGHDTTVPVTVDDIIYHSKIVARESAASGCMAAIPIRPGKWWRAPAGWRMRAPIWYCLNACPTSWGRRWPGNAGCR